MIVIAIAASVMSLGTPHSQRPRTADASVHGPAKSAMPASSVPPTFDRTALGNCPRMACAHEVVIPHEGQRAPNNVSKVQGGSPNC